MRQGRPASSHGTQRELPTGRVVAAGSRWAQASLLGLQPGRAFWGRGGYRIRGRGGAVLGDGSHREIREKTHRPCQGNASWTSPWKASEESQVFSWCSRPATHNSSPPSTPRQQREDAPFPLPVFSLPLPAPHPTLQSWPSSEGRTQAVKDVKLKLLIGLGFWPPGSESLVPS